MGSFFKGIINYKLFRSLTFGFTSSLDAFCKVSIRFFKNPVDLVDPVYFFFVKLCGLRSSALKDFLPFLRTGLK